MNLNEMNDSKWRSTNSNSDIGQDESMMEPINDEFHLLDEKHSDDFTTETMCAILNGQKDQRDVAAEEGLLNAMNNLQIVSVKKLKRFRDPMLRENLTEDNDKKTNENKLCETENVFTKALGSEINDMNKEAMKLLDTQPSTKITKTISKSRVDMSMSQSNCKHVVKTISDAEDGVHLKEEKIKFFGIPVTADRRKRTQVIPFNFQNRTKKNQQLQDPTGKSVVLSKSLSSANMIVAATKTDTKSSKNNTIIGKETKISNNSKIESQKMKETLCEVNQSKLHNFSYKNITIRKIVAKSSENIAKMNKENNISNNNIMKSQEIKPKLPPIGPKLHTDRRAKDRQKFEEKIKQRTLEIEEMRARVEQKKREKMKLEEISLRQKLQSKAKPMPVFKIPGPIRSTKPLTEPQSPAWAMKPKRLQ